MSDLLIMSGGGGGGSTPSGSENEVYATPNGSSGSASLRSLVAADLPANSPPTGSGFFGGFRIGEIPWAAAASQLWYQQSPGDLVAMLFYIDQEITITHIAVSVEAANGAATTTDAGLYSYTTGGLVANTAGFNGNSATVQTLAVVQNSGSVTLTPGWYWLAWCSETTSTSTMRCSAFNNTTDSSILSMMTARATTLGYHTGSGQSWASTGILPSTLPALTVWSTFRPFLAAYFSA